MSNFNPLSKMVNTPRIKFVFDRLKRSDRKKKLKGAIEIEVYYNGKQYRTTTGFCVLPSEWNAGNVTNRLDCMKINSILGSMLSGIYDYAVECQQDDIQCLSVDEIKRIVAQCNNKPAKERKPRIDLYAWLEERINERPIAESTRRQHKVMMRSLQESGIFKTFEDFTPANIRRWDEMLHNQLGCQSSVHGYHKRLKPYISIAIDMELISKSPYEKMRISRGKSSTKKFLREQERDAIEALELKGGHEIARDMFIFSCYTGLAYSDLVKITKEDILVDGDKMYIEDSRQKTGSEYKIVLLPKAVEILKKYDYNLNRLSNQKCNEYLKFIAFQCGIKINLTMHVGRHTFATWALKKGVPIEVVSKMLAHADIGTTQIYAKILQEEVDKGYDTLMAGA